MENTLTMDRWLTLKQAEYKLTHMHWGAWHQIFGTERLLMDALPRFRNPKYSLGAFWDLIEDYQTQHNGWRPSIGPASYTKIRDELLADGYDLESNTLTPRAQNEPPASPPQWEYKIVPLDAQYTDDDEDAINALGREGWELVAIDGTGADDPVAYFKRRRNVSL